MRKVCLICGMKNSKDKHNHSIVEWHHLHYYPEGIIPLCRPCHQIVTNYERGWDGERSEHEGEVIAVYNGIKPSAYVSRDSEVISIRVSSIVYNTLYKLADKRNMSVSTFVKGKVGDFVVKVNNSVIPFYNPSIHKVGERVMVRRGKKLVEMVVPELDGDGNPMPIL